MAKKSALDTFSRTLEIIKLMAQDGGTTVTEISAKTGIDRWTVKNMIDNLESLSPNGDGLMIEEYQSEKDKRQILYHIPKDTLWTLSLPSINLSDEEGLMLALMFSQSESSAFNQEIENLKKKLTMFKNVKEYQIINVQKAQKVLNDRTKKIIVTVLNAINTGKCIKFKYKPVRREVKEYELIPLGIFQYESGYYLAAQKLPGGEYRTFGLERAISISDVFYYDFSNIEIENYKERFEDPFGPFDHKEEFEVVLLFDSFQGFFNLEKDWPKSVKIEELEDETILMKVRTHSISGIKKWILSFGSSVKVLSPEWLCEIIQDEHNKASKLYLE